MENTDCKFLFQMNVVEDEKNALAAEFNQNVVDLAPKVLNPVYEPFKVQFVRRQNPVVAPGSNQPREYAFSGRAPPSYQGAAIFV